MVPLTERFRPVPPVVASTGASRHGDADERRLTLHFELSAGKGHLSEADPGVVVVDGALRV